jgi:DNA-binding transcriptional ArsR family regulator
MAEQSPATDVGGSTGGGDGEGASVSGTEPGAGSDARVVGLESTAAEDVIGAVSSETGRAVLETLQEEPSTASGLADRLECSLQTVQYHLGNLDEAGLIEVVETERSEKGHEMDVYGPTAQPVVVYAGDDDAADLRSVLKRLVSGVAFIGLVSLLVQVLLEREQPAGTDGVQVSAEYAGKAADTAARSGPEPGLVFFAGGVVVLVAYLSWWYLRRTGRLDGIVPA